MTQTKTEVKADTKTKTLSIYAKLSAISSELETVKKNLKVTGYMAVGEADVLRAIKPLEAKYGVYSYPFSRTIVESGQIDLNGKKYLYERIETVYRFVNIENTNEFVDITSYGDGVDTQDKSVGKAMTYADKYALLKAYKIVTGDDPDQEPSGKLESTSINKTEPKKPAPKSSNSAIYGISTELLNECDRLDIKIDNIAVYLKKNVKELTNNDLQTCINQKKKALGL